MAVDLVPIAEADLDPESEATVADVAVVFSLKVVEASETTDEPPFDAFDDPERVLPA